MYETMNAAQIEALVEQERRSYKTNCQCNLLFILLLLTLMLINSDSMSNIKTFKGSLYYWLWINFGFYILDMLFNYRSLKIINANNKKRLQ